MSQKNILKKTALVLAAMTLTASGIFSLQTHAQTTATATASVTVTAGSLTLTADAAAPLTCSGGCTTTSSAQTASGNVTNITLTDARGGTTPWTLTATATNFNQGTNWINLCNSITGTTCNTSRLSVTPTAISTLGGQTFAGTDNTSAQNVTTLTAVNATGTSNSFSLASSAAGGHNGQYRKNLGLGLTIPAFTPAAAYTSTITLTAI